MLRNCFWDSYYTIKKNENLHADVLKNSLNDSCPKECFYKFPVVIPRMILLKSKRLYYYLLYLKGTINDFVEKKM